MKLIETVEACCPVVQQEPLEPVAADRIASAFKVLSDPARLRLITMIAGNAETCVCDLAEAVGLSQPTVSHHLKVLLEAGLVEREQRGSWAYFRVVPDRLRALRELLA